MVGPLGLLAVPLLVACLQSLPPAPSFQLLFTHGSHQAKFLLSRESILEIIKKTVFKFGFGEHFNAHNLQPSLSYMSFESCAQPYDLKK